MSAQLQILKTKFLESNEKIVSTVINYIKNHIGVQTDFFSEINVLLKSQLVLPVANVTSERSASSIRRIETGWELQSHKND